MEESKGQTIKKCLIIENILPVLRERLNKRFFGKTLNILQSIKLDEKTYEAFRLINLFLGKPVLEIYLTRKEFGKHYPQARETTGSITKLMKTSRKPRPPRGFPNY